MSIILGSILLLFLFFMLGVAADFVVKQIKYVATVLKIKLFAFGIILGLVTTLPELSVGINATMEGAAGLSVGNILGGVIVMLGLVLGASLLLHREIKSEEGLKTLLPQVGIIIIPILLGLDGRYGAIDGLIMIAAYLGLVYYLYRAHRSFGGESLALIDKNKLAKTIFFALGGIVAIILLSDWIVDISLRLLENWQISKLVMGILIFAIGTNLPEISIAFSSWRKKTSELSLSHLLSSAFGNILILGILASIKPISISVGPAYYVLAAFLVLTLVLFTIFYRSQQKMDRREGAALIACYIFFIAVNFILI